MESIEGGNREDGSAPLAKITPLDKIIVAIAGPVFSIGLALLSAAIVWGVGKPKDFVPTTTIGYVMPDSPGEKAGFKAGDEILEINGKAVNGFQGTLGSITERIVLSSGDNIAFSIKRPGEEEPIVLTSGFDRPESRWFQRSGLRQVGLVPAGRALVGKVYENSPADQAGLAKGDVILSVDGAKLYSAVQLSEYLKANDFETVRIGIEKADGSTIVANLEPKVPLSPAGYDPMLGVLWDRGEQIDTQIVHPNPFRQVADSLNMMWVTVSTVADPGTNIGVDHLSGPVGIGKMMYSLAQTEDGWRRILFFMVLFNVNLAVLNMLPFPVLDGGHIALALMEVIAGRPVQTKILEIVQTGCAVVLISLMLYVTTKDIGDGIRPGESRSEGREPVFAAD